MKKNIFHATLFALLSLWGLQALAANCTSGGDHNWGTGGQWSCGHEPTIDDDVTIRSGDTVRINRNAIEAKSLTVNGLLSGNSTNFWIRIAGNLTINSGAVFDAQLANSGSGNNTIGGNLVNLGAFNTNASNSGYWEFNGTTAQTISGNVAFPNVKISNSNAATGVTVVNGTTLTIKDYGKLDLTSARISTDSNSKVSITATQCNQNHSNIQGGWVNGNLQYNFPGDNGACTFKIGDASNYAPVTLNVIWYNGINSNGAGGTLTASTKGVAHPNLATSGLSTTKYVKRYWTIGSADDSFSCVNGANNVGYTATFNFVPGDIQGGANTGAFAVGRNSNGWATPAQTARSSTSTRLEVAPSAGTAAWGSYAIGETSGSPSGGPTNNCSNASPVAEWRMDESSWTVTPYQVFDSVGGYHGVAGYSAGSGPRPSTSTGSPAYTAPSSGLNTCGYGLFDNASNPAQTYTYVQLGSFPSLGAQFTFAGWVRTTNASASGQRILVNDDNQNGWGFSLGDGGTGTLRLFNRTITNDGAVSGAGVNGNCGVFCIDTNNVISNNTWYFVAATVNTAGRDVTLYVFNSAGVLQARVTGKYAGTWGNGTGAVAIGGESSGGEATQTGFHFKGNIDEVKVYGAALSENALKSELTRARSCTASVNHIRIEHDGEGLTCSPEKVTVKACADANCLTLYSGSVTLNLSPGGSGITFTGSTSNATVSKNTTGDATLAATDVSPGVISATRCFNGTTETCTMKFVESGFVLSVSPHTAETDQIISIKAVKKADSSVACVPAFANVSKAINLACGYSNPTSGQAAVRVNGTALNAANAAGSACDANGASVSLSFDANGEAKPTLRYADVGRMTLTANTTLATTNDMTGSTSFVVAPASFVFDAITGPIKAGAPFSARVTARNAANNVTPNFGLESAPETETVELRSVTTAAASASNSQLVGPSGGVTGSLTTGTKGLFTRATCDAAARTGATCSNTLAWTEVGDVNLVAAGKTTNGYLASGLKPWGMTAVRFIPAFFETTFNPVNTQGCGSFTYSGQPFRLTVTARSQANTELASSIATTQNYTGSYAKAVTLGSGSASACASTVCSATTPCFSNDTLPASGFSNGVANTAPVDNTAAPLPIAYTQPLDVPATVNVCAKETSADGVNSLGQVQAALAIRNGRLRLSNAFGTERQPLAMPVQAEFWSGNSWVLSSLDNCTKLVAANFYKSSNLTNASDVTLSGGKANLMLSAPGAGNAVSVDIAANLGTSGSDQSCLGGHGGTPGKLPWLRSRNGSCATTYDRDPSARATFGIYSPESRRVIHTREFFF